MASFGYQQVAETEEMELQQLSGTDSEHITPPTKWRKFAHGQMIKVAMVGTALMALLATSFYCTGFSTVSTISLDHHGIILNEDMDEDVDNCQRLTLLKPSKVVRSNLGGKGPDEGDEGIMYDAEVFMADVNGNRFSKAVKVAIHATSLYDVPGPLDFNGMHGKFFSVKLVSGKSVKLNVTILDVDGQPLSLPFFSVTFFDIDMSLENKSKEYIIAKDFVHYYIANGTQLEVTGDKDGPTTFKASESGTSGDNPQVSEALTILAKSKGVTLQYERRSSVDFEFGVEEGENSSRGFQFTIRPSLLCAKTVVDGKQVDPWDTSVPGVLLPLMDGVLPVKGMDIPSVVITENGIVIITGDNGTNLTLGNVSLIVDNEDGTLTVELDNGTQIPVDGHLNASEDGTPIINGSIGVSRGQNGGVSPQSGTLAMLIAVILWAAV